MYIISYMYTYMYVYLFCLLENQLKKTKRKRVTTKKDVFLLHFGPMILKVNKGVLFGPKYL